MWVPVSARIGTRFLGHLGTEYPGKHTNFEKQASNNTTNLKIEIFRRKIAVNRKPANSAFAATFPLTSATMRGCSPALFQILSSLS